MAPLQHTQFNTRTQLVRHFRDNADCDIQNKLEQISLIKCPNANCNTWWSNKNELRKHLSFHCHPTCGGKESPHQRRGN